MPGRPVAADALLSLLLPIWQVAIGACVVAAVVVAGWRLGQRGPSRMSRAMLVVGAAILALAVLGVIFQE